MSPEVSNLVAEAVKEIAVYFLITLFGCIGAVVAALFKMKHDLANVLKAVNGVGNKLNALTEKHHTQNLKVARIQERLSMREDDANG